MKRWAKYIAWVLAVLVVGVVSLQFIAPELVQQVLENWHGGKNDRPELTEPAFVNASYGYWIFTDPEQVHEAITTLLACCGEKKPFRMENGGQEVDIYMEDRSCGWRICDYTVNIYEEKTALDDCETYSFDTAAWNDFLSTAEWKPLGAWTDPDRLTSIRYGWLEDAGAYPPQDWEPQPLPEEEWSAFCEVLSDWTASPRRENDSAIGTTRALHFELCAEVGNLDVEISTANRLTKILIWCDPLKTRFVWTMIDENPFERWTSEE